MLYSCILILYQIIYTFICDQNFTTETLTALVNVMETINEFKILPKNVTVQFLYILISVLKTEDVSANKSEVLEEQIFKNCCTVLQNQVFQ